MTKSLYNIILFCAATLFFSSCKKEQPEITNPLAGCDCTSEVNANFVMGQMVGGKLYDLDTVHYYLNYELFPNNVVSENLGSACKVNFSANYPNATSYEWKIGSNTYTSKDFFLYFQDTIGTIPVKLIVHSNPNSICFPNDDGVDTVVRYLTIKSLKHPPLIGQYWGHNTDSPNNNFLVEIDTFRFGDNYQYIGYGIKNLPNGNGFDHLGSYSTIGFEGCYEAAVGMSQDASVQFYSTATSTPIGVFDKTTNQLKVTYSANYFQGQQIINQLANKTFVGQKL